MKDDAGIKKNSLVMILVFSLILFLVTLLYDFILLKYLHDLNYVQLYQTLLTLRNFIPLLSVIATILLLRMRVRESLKEYGLRKCKFRLLLLSGLMPYLMYGIGVFYAFAIGLEVVNPLIPLYRDYGTNLPEGGEGFILTLSLLSTLFVGSTILCLIMLGQELGWRGLLLKEVLTTLKNPLISSVLVGILWGLWYAPLITLYGIYYPQHRDLVGILTMVTACCSLSILFSHLRLKIGSVLAPSAASGVLNGLHNLMVYTVISDEIYSMPVGILGISATITLAVIMHFIWK
ncbi:MAG: CPBP family glutamic-type intramembrane protease [Sulfolobales archaeon]